MIDGKLERKALAWVPFSGWVWIVVAALGCTSVGSFDGADDHCARACKPLVVAEMPAQFYQGLAIVEVQVEGLDRLARFVIDTGSVSVIRADLASQVAFSVDGSAASSLFEDTAGRQIDAEPILLRRLKLGQLEFRRVPAALVASQVFDRICPPIDGLLGTGGLSSERGFLDRVAIEINRDRQRVRWSRDGSLLDGDDITLPLRRYVVSENGEKVDDSGTWVPVVLEGHLLWAQLDTGGGGLSTMTSDVFSRFLGRSVEDDDVRDYIGEYGMSASGLSEARQSWIAVIQDVQLGRFRFDALPFRIVQPRDDGMPLVVLKQNLLEYFNIILDYHRSEMRVSLADTGPQSVGLPLQLGWHVRDGHTVIVGMLGGGVAQRAGVELGDEVVMVGDAVIDSGDPQSMCRETMRWRRSNSDLRLLLRRNDREFEVTLPKTDRKLGE